jgi:acetyl esterase/lipase
MQIDPNLKPVDHDLAGYTRKFVYRSVDGVDLPMAVYEPDRQRFADPRPAIIIFHGGGWTGGFLHQFQYQAIRLAERGMLVALPAYRVGKRHGTTPWESVADARAAVAYVHEHAADWQIDPRRIVIAGSSAGGHLAACVTLIDDPLTAGLPQPPAMVLFNPVLDTSPDGYGYPIIGDDWQRISPLHHEVTNAPPTLVLHGDTDRTIPLDVAQRFTEKMHAAGNRCVLVVYPGAGHGFFNAGRGEGGYHDQTLAAMESFLDSQDLLASS